MSDAIDTLRAQPVPLFAQIAAPVRPGFFGRMLGKKPPLPEPLGELGIDDTKVQIRRGAHGVFGEVDTARPVTLDLRRVVGAPGSVELTAVLRSLDEVITRVTNGEGPKP